VTLLGFIVCRPLLLPCEYVRVEKRELGEISRVLARVCRTAEATELVSETLGLSGEELNEVSGEAPFKPRVAAESFCSAIVRTGANMALPKELGGRELKEE
jgi:hypothetical protein